MRRWIVPLVVLLLVVWVLAAALVYTRVAAGPARTTDAAVLLHTPAATAAVATAVATAVAPAPVPAAPTPVSGPTAVVTDVARVAEMRRRVANAARAAVMSRAASAVSSPLSNAQAAVQAPAAAAVSASAPAVVTAKPPAEAQAAVADANAKAKAEVKAEVKAKGKAKRFVAFGSTHDPQYLFYAPVAALLWARLGWTPLFLYVSNAPWDRPTTSPTASPTAPPPPPPEFDLVQHYVERIAGGKVVTIHPRDYEAAAVSLGERDVTAFVRKVHGMTWLTAQMSRIFAACDAELPRDAVLMTSDVDMLVLSNALWQPPPPTGADATPDALAAHAAAAREAELVPAHYYGFKPPRLAPEPQLWSGDTLGFQMCFLHARVWAWRQALGLSAAEQRDGCNAGGKIASLIGRRTRIEWGDDQNFVSSAFRGWRNTNPHAPLMTPAEQVAQPPTARSTRMDLHFRDYSRFGMREMDGRFRPWTYADDTDWSQYATAHAPRPDGFSSAKWHTTRLVLASVLPPDVMMHSVDWYYAQWTGAQPKHVFPPEQQPVVAADDR